VSTSSHALTRCYLSFLASSLVFATAAAQAAQGTLSPERLKRVNEMAERAIAAGEITGAVTLVVQNGRIVHQQAHGVMDKDSKKPVRTDTYFRIASMTKPVTAVAIMMMVEEGKVRLTDPVSRFLPSFKDQTVAVLKPPPPPGPPGSLPPLPPPPGTPPDHYTVPAERDITVFDLLTHTSGLMSGPIGNAAGDAAFQKRREVGLKWVDDLGRTPLEFQPGSRWTYSPVAGFDVLARIVEIASGQDFNTFLRERLFAPLGMKETFFWPTEAQRERLATVYDMRRDGQLEPRPDPDSMASPVYSGGGGGLISTAESYARFGMMLANGGELNGRRILGRRAVELLRSVHIPDTLPGREPGEAFGLSVRVIADPAKRRSLLSAGSFGWSGAYGTHFWVDPEEKIVAVFLTQRWGFHPENDFETAVMQALVD